MVIGRGTWGPSGPARSTVWSDPRVGGRRWERADVVYNIPTVCYNGGSFLGEKTLELSLVKKKYQR